MYEHSPYDKSEIYSNKTVKILSTNLPTIANITDWQNNMARQIYYTLTWGMSGHSYHRIGSLAMYRE